VQQVLSRPTVVPEFAWIRSVQERPGAWLEVIWSRGVRDGEPSIPCGSLLMQAPAAPLALPAVGDLAWLRDDGTLRSWTSRHDGSFPTTTTLDGPIVFALAPGDTATVTRFENPAGGTLPFPRAFAEIRQLMIDKRPTKGDAWREQPVAMHVARMTIHASRALAGAHAEVGPDDDLMHAVVRGLMALERRAEARARLAAEDETA
jgi:hypothetical protein